MSASCSIDERGHRLHFCSCTQPLFSDSIDAIIEFSFDGLQGKGTVFHFWIQAELVAQLPPPPPTLQRHLQGRKVAICGCRPKTAYSIECAMKMLGAQVVVFPDLQQMRSCLAEVKTNEEVDHMEQSSIWIALVLCNTVDQDNVTMCCSVQPLQLHDLPKQFHLPIIAIDGGPFFPSSSAAALNLHQQGHLTQEQLSTSLATPAGVLSIKRPIRFQALQSLFLSLCAELDRVNSSSAIVVPLSARSLQLAKSSVPAVDRARPVSILVAEDNIFNQKVITKLLHNIGYSNVDLAWNGVEAVAAAKRKRYDLILMDVMVLYSSCSFILINLNLQMPEMGGVEATQHIFAEISAEQQPGSIVALTADVFAENRDNCLKSGMRDVLYKPCSKETLKLVLEKYCRR